VGTRNYLLITIIYKNVLKKDKRNSSSSHVLCKNYIFTPPVHHVYRYEVIYSVIGCSKPHVLTQRSIRVKKTVDRLYRSLETH
jgi:hypothetical protein